MLLHTLRRSHTLTRWVLVWFVLAMGMAVAAPAVQPVSLGGICSASATVPADPSESSGAVANHDALKCVLCLGAGAPPVVEQASLVHAAAPTDWLPLPPSEVVLSARNSPLSARAPPAL